MRDLRLRPRCSSCFRSSRMLCCLCW